MTAVRRSPSRAGGASMFTFTRLVAAVAVVSLGAALAARSLAPAGTPGVPYAKMPALAPIGVRVDRYLDVPDAAEGPGGRSGQGLPDREARGGPLPGHGRRLSVDVHDLRDGVVVVDAPPSYAARIPAAIAEVTDKPITHVVYSHSHSDHIGGTRTSAASDHHRPTRDEPAAGARQRSRPPAGHRHVRRQLPTDGRRARCSSCPITASRTRRATSSSTRRKQKTLMVVDVVFPGWMPWRRFAVAQDVPAVLRAGAGIDAWDVRHLRRRSRQSNRHARGCRARSSRSWRT